MIWQAVIYFTACFTVLNLWLVAQLRALRHSDDESRKGRVVLKGLVAHFAFSLLVLIVYHRFIYQATMGEALIGLSLYGASFVAFIAAAMKVR